MVGSTLSFAILAFLLVAGGVVFFVRRKTQKKPFTRYEEKALLTADEVVLFNRLHRALPNYHIFPHVPLSSLVTPMEAHRRRQSEHRNQIAGLMVDYAVYGGEMELVCVVVLDSEISGPSQDRLAEKCLKSAGIKIIRWNASPKPSVEQIARAILPLGNNAKPPLESGTTINPDTVQMIYKSEPLPSNITGLTQAQLDKLTPNKVISKSYPHIWQRICLFAPEPKHLQKYLLTLSIQDRGEKRAGFPIEALKEIADIQTENDRFLSRPVTAWQPAFINR